MVKILSVPMFATAFASIFFFILYLYLSHQTRNRDREHSAYFIFSLLSLVNTIYIGSFGVVINCYDNLEMLSFFNRVTISASAFVVLLNLHFSKFYFDIPGKKDLVFFYIINTIFTVICFSESPLFLGKEFYQTSRFYTGLTQGILFKVWGGYIIVKMFYVILVLCKGYFVYTKNGSRKKRAIVFSIVVAIVWYTCGILDALTAVDIVDFPPLSWAGSLTMLLCIEIILVTTIDDLYIQISNLYGKVIRDSTTEVFSRSYFEVELDRRLHNNRGGQNLSHFIIFVDLDDFKGINDTYGHIAGDMVLKKVAEIMTSGVRNGDIVARYGGDEFIVLISAECDIENVKKIVERIRKKIECLKFTSDGKSFGVTCSFGILSCGKNLPKNIKAKDEIISKADEALYKSKREGKNRIYTIELEKAG